MGGGGHEDNVLRLLQDLDPAVVVDLLIQKVHEVDGVVVHPVQKHVRGVQDHADLYLWVGLMEGLHKIREDGGADGFDGPDGQGPGQLLAFGHCGPGAGDLPHDGGGMVIEDHALMGQDGLFSDAVKQMDPQLLL